MSAKVSIIIPAYNSEQCIDRTLQSVRAQEFGKDAQVIVVDDCSTDGTVEKVEAFDMDITLLRHTENKGQGAARNSGLEVATGEYVTFLDADDYWLNGFLTTVIPLLDTQFPQAVAVSAEGVMKQFNGKEYKVPGETGISQTSLVKDFFDFWGKYDHIRTGTAVIRKTVIDEAGFQRGDLRISQDVEYWGYIATFGQWVFHPELFFVSEGTASARGQSWKKKYERRRKLCPSVESWQSRIIGRLKEEQLEGFKCVRGRIAFGYALAKILGNDSEGARQIAVKYGADFPSNRVARWIKNSCGKNGLKWGLVCRFLRSKESFKSMVISMQHVFSRKVG